MLIKIKSSIRNPIGAVLGRLINAAYDFTLKHKGEFYHVKILGDVNEKEVKRLINPVVRTHKKGDFVFIK